MNYQRKCPQCKKNITYNSKLTYERGNKNKSVCGACANYNKNPIPFTKREFCELYYNQNLTVSKILIKFNYQTHTIMDNGSSSISNRILKHFKLPKRKYVINLRKKRFVTKHYNTCPITGQSTDYLEDGDYIKAYRNLVDRFNNGNIMRLGSSYIANTPNLTIKQLRLRTLLEKHTDKTICCQCIKIKLKSEMSITSGLPRTCKDCVLPKQRVKAKEYAKNKRDSLGKEEYNKQQREYRKTLSPEKKYEQYLKINQWKSKQPNWGNKPMSEEEKYCRRLLHLTVRMLGSEKTTSTYGELGYTPQELHNKIGPKIEGCDLDHKIPISWFIKQTPISVVNSLYNLQWVSSKYNRAKQNFWFDNITIEYFNVIKPYIKTTRIDRFVIENDYVYDFSFGEYIPELILD